MKSTSCRRSSTPRETASDPLPRTSRARCCARRGSLGARPPEGTVRSPAAHSSRRPTRSAARVARGQSMAADRWMDTAHRAGQRVGIRRGYAHHHRTAGTVRSRSRTAGPSLVVDTRRSIASLGTRRHGSPGTRSAPDSATANPLHGASEAVDIRNPLCTVASLASRHCLGFPDLIERR